MKEIITRILNENRCPQLLEILAKMESSDLQSLLLKLYQDKTSKLTPAKVLKQYESNRFVTPADISPLQLHEFEKLVYHCLPPGFEAILLSPLSPLGSCSALGTVNQNKVISTIRNTEICADSTNIMALESARRRKFGKSKEMIKLASCHRLMRAQKFDNPAFSTHFSIAGRMTADYEQLLFALEEHIEFYLKLLGASAGLGLMTKNVRLGITAINPNLKQRLHEQIINPLSNKYPQYTLLLDQTRKSALNYYKDFSMAINIQSPLDGNYYQLVDGGNTDWTQNLLNNRKEFFMSSCIGIDLFLKMFKETQETSSQEIRIIIDDKLELSNIRWDDMRNLAFHANSPEIACNLKDVFPSPYTITDAKNFIGMAIQNGARNLAIRSNSEIIGCIGITPGTDIHRNEAELGYWLSYSHWNKGIMSHCVKRYIDYIFRTTDFTRIYAEIFTDNIASIKVLEKCGFTKEGTLRRSVVKNGKLKDTYIFAILKNE